MARAEGAEGGRIEKLQRIAKGLSEKKTYGVRRERLGFIEAPHSTPEMRWEDKKPGSECTPSSLVCQDLQMSLGKEKSL